MGALSIPRYSQGMARTRKPGEGRRYPNRIREIATAQGLTYEALGSLVGAHEITIARLATGKMKLTQDWMTKLSAALGVTAQEIIGPPPAAGMRRVRVTGAIQAGVWSENHEWPYDDQYDAMVPFDPSLSGVQLYAGQIRGESMNRRYPDGAIVIMSPCDGKSWRGDLLPGRRYHVRRTRKDGLTEETIKTLIRDERGRYWLQPESTDPEFSQAIPLDPDFDGEIEIIGRVRFVVQRED